MFFLGKVTPLRKRKEYKEQTYMYYNVVQSKHEIYDGIENTLNNIILLLFFYPVTKLFSNVYAVRYMSKLCWNYFCVFRLYRNIY